MLLPLLENWPAKSKIITEICAQSRIIMPQTGHSEPWTMTLNWICFSCCLTILCNSVLPSENFNSGCYSFDRSSYQLGYLMLPKRKCWQIKSGFCLTLQKDHICILIVFCWWLEALERVTQDAGSFPLASLTHSFPKGYKLFWWMKLYALVPLLFLGP